MPAGDELFKVSEQQQALSSEKKKFFHSTVAKLLYLAKRARPDVLMATSFLCTRVQQPTLEDWRKLKKVIAYLKTTRGMGVDLGVGSGGIKSVHAYIDSSFAVHPDCKGHTGAVITFGAGAIYCKSAKQKISAKSSTEAEIIGLSEAGSQFIWTRHFLIAQGYDIGQPVIFHDNVSAIVLTEKKTSAKQRIKHLDIKYQFLRDYVDRKEVAIKFKKSAEMLADFLTKPLHGEVFKRFRAQLLNSE